PRTSGIVGHLQHANTAHHPPQLMSRLSTALSSLDLPAPLAPQLENFVVIFKKWNASINLSAARTADEITEHVVDSLHVVPHLGSLIASSAPIRVLDVGSGGGMPVVVAAICLPAFQFTSLEPVHKKHAFLRTAARELNLPNLDARAERLEQHAHRDYDAAM